MELSADKEGPLYFASVETTAGILAIKLENVN